jgi:hypothetical protein
MVRSHPQYTKYDVSIDYKVVCLFLTKNSVFVVELNVELKPQENDIKISPNLIYGAIDPLVDRI